MNDVGEGAEQARGRAPVEGRLRSRERDAVLHTCRERGRDASLIRPVHDADEQQRRLRAAEPGGVPRPHDAVGERRPRFDRRDADPCGRAARGPDGQDLPVAETEPVPFVARQQERPLAERRGDVSGAEQLRCQRVERDRFDLGDPELRGTPRGGLDPHRSDGDGGRARDARHGTHLRHQRTRHATGDGDLQDRSLGGRGRGVRAAAAGSRRRREQDGRDHPAEAGADERRRLRHWDFSDKNPTGPHGRGHIVPGASHQIVTCVR